MTSVSTAAERSAEDFSSGRLPLVLGKRLGASLRSPGKPVELSSNRRGDLDLGRGAGGGGDRARCQPQSENPADGASGLVGLSCGKEEGSNGVAGRRGTKGFGATETRDLTVQGRGGIGTTYGCDRHPQSSIQNRELYKN